MINPSKSGWILKYLHLLEQGEIRPNFSANAAQGLEQRILESGFSFGFCFDLLYAKEIGEEQWTPKEKFMVLYLEVLLSVYFHSKLESKSPVHFMACLDNFQSKFAHNGKVSRFFNVMMKSDSNRTEDFIEDRVKILMNQFDDEPMEQISGAFGFLDAQMFAQSLDSDFQFEHSQTLKKSLQVLIFISSQSPLENAKDDFKKNAQAIFSFWGFSKEESSQAFQEITKPGFLSQAKLSLLSAAIQFFLLEYAVYYSLSDNRVKLTENLFVEDLARALELDQQTFEKVFLSVENFLFTHEEALQDIKNQGVYGKVVGKINTQWSKLVLRNKDKLVVELKESSELVALVKKSMSEPLSAEEKQKVKSQFFDIVKSVPSLAIFMLPGGAFLLPFILKVIPDLLPSAFKDNEIEE